MLSFIIEYNEITLGEANFVEDANLKVCDLLQSARLLIAHRQCALMLSENLQLS